VGSGLGTTPNYLRGAAGNGRAQRSSSFDAHRAPPRATAWAPRLMNTALRCTTSATAGIGVGNTPNYLFGAADIVLGTTAKYLRRSTSGAAGNGLFTTTKYLRGAAGIGLGTTIKYLRRTTSAAAKNGLDTTIQYIVNQTRARATTGPRPTYTKAGHEFRLIPL
jgi:hypothetical protein